MRYKFLLLSFIFTLCSACLSAQLIDDVRKLLTDTTEEKPAVTLRSDSDSLVLMNMQLELQEARLNEANMRMQLEEMKLHQISGDSIKRVAQQKRIDSLRTMTEGVPVVVEDDTLFYLYAKNGGFSAHQRAEMEAHSIDQLGRRMKLQPDSVYLENNETSTDLMYGNKVVTSITDQDAMWTGSSRRELAAHHNEIVTARLR